MSGWADSDSYPINTQTLIAVVGFAQNINSYQCTLRSIHYINMAFATVVSEVVRRESFLQMLYMKYYNSDFILAHKLVISCSAKLLTPTYRPNECINLHIIEINVSL